MDHNAAKKKMLIGITGTVGATNMESYLIPFQKLFDINLVPPGMAEQAGSVVQ